jgi:hypothetical protein
LKLELLSLFLGVIVAFTIVSLIIEPEKNFMSEMPAAGIPAEKMTYEVERIQTPVQSDDKSTEYIQYLALPFSFLAAILVYQTSIRRLG